MHDTDEDQHIAVEVALALTTGRRRPHLADDRLLRIADRANVNRGGCFVAVRETFPVIELVELDAEVRLCDVEEFEVVSVCRFDFADG
jgi:hypothetical protein